MNKIITKIEDPSKIYFTSDTHFSHKSILKGGSSWGWREFNSIEEHDAELIRRWNEVVPQDGIVYHLGDFCFGSIRRWEEVRAQLNGKIHLIVGNHDLKTLDKYEQRSSALFESISYQQVLDISPYRIYLNHYPYLCMAGVYDKDPHTWQFFGHVHTGSMCGKDDERLYNLFSTQVDVGVDAHGYRPHSFDGVEHIVKLFIEIDGAVDK